MIKYYCASQMIGLLHVSVCAIIYWVEELKCVLMWDNRSFARMYKHYSKFSFNIDSSSQNCFLYFADYHKYRNVRKPWSIQYRNEFFCFHLLSKLHICCLFTFHCWIINKRNRQLPSSILFEKHCSSPNSCLIQMGLLVEIDAIAYLFWKQLLND